MHLVWRHTTLANHFHYYYQASSSSFYHRYCHYLELLNKYIDIIYISMQWHSIRCLYQMPWGYLCRLLLLYYINVHCRCIFVHTCMQHAWKHRPTWTFVHELPSSIHPVKLFILRYGNMNLITNRNIKVKILSFTRKIWCDSRRRNDACYGWWRGWQLIVMMLNRHRNGIWCPFSRIKMMMMMMMVSCWEWD